MRGLLTRFTSFRDRVKTRERQYGWLFPAIVPLCLGAAIFASTMIPVIAHWDAVDVIENAGGRVKMTPAFLPLINIRMPVFSEARAVELVGNDIDDQVFKLAGNLRGLERIEISSTRVTEQAIERFRKTHPDVAIVRL